MSESHDAQPSQVEALVHESKRLRYSRRTILRRATALGLSAPALASVLAQVQPAAAQSGPVTVTWFAARDQSGFSPTQVEAFNAANPNIQISYQEQGATTTDLHDGAGEWQPARLEPPLDPYAWQVWTFTWEVTEPARHVLRARATDASGATQPDTPPWNRLGYGNNAVGVIVVNVR